MDDYGTRPRFRNIQHRLPGLQGEERLVIFEFIMTQA